MSDASESTKKGFSIEDIPWYTVPAVLLGVPALLAILSAIWPEVFFDNFVDKYYWQPIKSDTGYNAVNTVSWAILLGLCLLGLSQMVNGLKLKVDSTFIYGAVAWVVTGAIFRVLEDTGMFRPPLQYVMITPPIYLLFAVFAIIALMIGLYVQRVAKAADLEAALQKLWFIQAIFVLLYTLLWAAEWSQVTVYLNPVTVALLAALNYFLIRYRVLKVQETRPVELMLMLAIAPFLMGMAYVIQFIVDPWRASGTGIPSSFITVPLLAIGLTGVAVSAVKAGLTGKSQDNRWIAAFAAFFAVMLGIVIWTAPAVTRTPFNVASVLSIAAIGLLLGGIGVLVARRLHKKEVAADKLTPFLAPVNIFLIISQVMDGFATSLGLDLAGYTEKHVLSAFIINAFESLSESIGWQFGADYPTFLAFVPIKLGISLAVVYAIDVYSKEDVEKYPALIGFVKFAIIMVGIGPAVRDFVRLSLGV